MSHLELNDFAMCKMLADNSSLVYSPSLVYSVRKVLCCIAVGLQLVTVPFLPLQAREQPNVVFILADDLGYGDLGCYGQQVITTPNLDRMASEGMRFRQFYAGCTVCAPSRSVLMTGQHMGHTHVRGNAAGDMSVQALRDVDLTLAELVQPAGYTTALCGKWGLGDVLPGAKSGLPNRQGFDHFFGYLGQHHAHNYYPTFLWRNTAKMPLRNNLVAVGGSVGKIQGGYATQRLDYSHDLVIKDALEFIHRNHAQPFFLYLALTIPHANNERAAATGNGQEVPEDGIYAQLPWSDADKGQAAMITRMDRDVGRLLQQLRELGIDQHTVVMFSSDNGHHDEGGHSTARFQPNGPLRGSKRDLYEGGIRVPLIVRWPGKVPAGQTTDHISYFGDLMATCAELAQVDTPSGIDSISLLPVITGVTAHQAQHKYLYWEFYECGGKQAVRQGKWKAVRMPMFTGQTELYDLDTDLGEAHDLAAEQPDVVSRLEVLMNEAHVPHPNWKPRGTLESSQPVPGDGRARF